MTNPDKTPMNRRTASFTAAPELSSPLKKGIIALPLLMPSALCHMDDLDPE
jgi:hypothetical protein